MGSLDPFKDHGGDEYATHSSLLSSRSNSSPPDIQALIIEPSDRYFHAANMDDRIMVRLKLRMGYQDRARLII